MHFWKLNNVPSYQNYFNPPHLFGSLPPILSSLILEFIITATVVIRMPVITSEAHWDCQKHHWKWYTDSSSEATVFLFLYGVNTESSLGGWWGRWLHCPSVFKLVRATEVWQGQAQRAGNQRNWVQVLKTLVSPGATLGKWLTPGPQCLRLWKRFRPAYLTKFIFCTSAPMTHRNHKVRVLNKCQGSLMSHFISFCTCCFLFPIRIITYSIILPFLDSARILK